MIRMYKLKLVEVQRDPVNSVGLFSDAVNHVLSDRQAQENSLSPAIHTNPFISLPTFCSVFVTAFITDANFPLGVQNIFLSFIFKIYTY